MTTAEALAAFAPYVPLAQTLFWAALVVLGCVIFRSSIRAVVEAVRVRIETGSSLKAGPLELGEDLRDLEYIPAGSSAAVPETGERSQGQWSTERDAIYAASRGVFLAHVIEPSSEPGQKYDIFIYLVRHKSTDFTDIEFGEFFLGSYWGNRVYREEADHGLIGMSTSAYGPMLCTCRVHFRDGTVAALSRYIDFEMGRVFEEGPPNKALQQTGRRRSVRGGS